MTQRGNAQRVLDPLTEERIARNDATFRDANERIGKAAEGLGLTEGALPFLCECADTSCRTLIQLTLDEYRRVRSNPTWFANAPGHEEADQGTAKVVERYERYFVVEKTGHAAEVARELAGEEGVS
jgi:hypothetical protein